MSACLKAKTGLNTEVDSLELKSITFAKICAISTSLPITFITTISSIRTVLKPYCKCKCKHKCKQSILTSLQTDRLKTSLPKTNNIYVYRQGYQLTDYSLRSQTFCYTADLSTTFLYMLKTKTFLHIPSQNHHQAS